MMPRLRRLTAIFLIINLLMVSGVTASVAHLPDDHYSAHLSIVHSHADQTEQHDELDHEHQLHLHLIADLVSFSLIFQTRSAYHLPHTYPTQWLTLYYSPLLPPPNA